MAQEQWETIYTSFKGNDHNDAEGWIVSNNYQGNLFTKCNGVTLFGGYNAFGKDAIVSKLFKLPPHHQLKITFQFWKIDSWNAEFVYLIAEDYKWSQGYIYYQGTQQCGVYYSDWNEMSQLITRLLVQVTNRKTLSHVNRQLKSQLNCQKMIQHKNLKFYKMHKSMKKHHNNKIQMLFKLILKKIGLMNSLSTLQIHLNIYQFIKHVLMMGVHMKMIIHNYVQCVDYVQLVKHLAQKAFKNLEQIEQENCKLQCFIFQDVIISFNFYNLFFKQQYIFQIQSLFQLLQNLGQQYEELIINIK
ncbi:unnamed protein product [Paramecium pentaurelia]|uniref:Uncharacterized protein n=1 Tax=Paramecium pentaurelia TaxID=43138 RepID=A0A8S1TUM6_9CILI|nr:unnamed protein product [Paramecium pentaurelia]